MNIRRALPSEHQVLTDLAMRSKAYWGYDQAFLDACAEDLTVTTDMILEHTTCVAVHSDTILGFYLVTSPGYRMREVLFFFVRPDMIGTGIGSMLFRHMELELAQESPEPFILTSDPNAEGFYERMGGQPIGHEVSPVGRSLKVYKFNFIR